jgi:uncharacterized membrane protein
MNTKIADVLSLILIVSTVAVTAFLYADLPDPMPSHWNVAGEVDAYMSKPWGVAILPFAAIGIFGLMKALPRISHKSFEVQGVDRAIAMVQLVMIALMCGVAMLVLFEATGVDTQMNRLIYSGIGLVFVVIGIAFRSVPKNLLFGVRTPWSMASDAAWRSTHLVGSWTFMLAGLLLVANAFVPLNLVWTIVAVFVLLLFPAVFSYFAYRRAKADGAT